MVPGTGSTMFIGVESDISSGIDFVATGMESIEARLRGRRAGGIYYKRIYLLFSYKNEGFIFNFLCHALLVMLYPVMLYQVMLYPIMLYRTMPNAPTLHLQIFDVQSHPVLMFAELFTILILLGCGVGVK
jgi:hypothetical protein